MKSEDGQTILHVLFMNFMQRIKRGWSSIFSTVNEYNSCSGSSNPSSVKAMCILILRYFYRRRGERGFWNECRKHSPNL